MIDLQVKSKLEVLIGKKLFDIFKQLDMFILNFGDELEYSLHVFSFVRVRNSHELIMTAMDEYYLPNHKVMSNRTYKKDSLHEKSLLNKTLIRAKELLQHAVVSSIEVTEFADINICFNNGIVIECISDCLGTENEYFRFFKYQDESSPHYIVKYDGKNVILEEDF